MEEVKKESLPSGCKLTWEPVGLFSNPVRLVAEIQRPQKARGAKIEFRVHVGPPHAKFSQSEFKLLYQKSQEFLEHVQGEAKRLKKA